MRIIIIGLNLERSHPQYLAFRNSPAENILKRIIECIEFTCSGLMEQEPNSRWIIAWQELLIQENTALRSISNPLRKKFKAEMNALILKYPNLAILSGSILTSAHSHSIESLINIKDFYAKTKWADTLEEKACIGFEKRFRPEHAQRVCAAIESLPNSSIDIYKNTTHLFQRSLESDNPQVIIHRHDKIFPAENEINTESPHSIFKPGKEDSASCIFNINHLDANAHFSIGVEICREHGIGLLQYELKEKSLTTPLIQFILSNYIKSFKEFFAAPYIIHLDSLAQPALIITNSENYSFTDDIVLYKHHLLDPFSPSKKVIPSFYYQTEKYHSLEDQEKEVTYLLTKKPSVETQYQLYFALRCAIIYERVDIIKTMLTYPNCSDILGYSAHLSDSYLIDFAFFQGNHEIFNLIVSKLDQCHHPKLLTRGIILSVRMQSYHILDKLIACGGDPNMAVKEIISYQRRSYENVTKIIKCSNDREIQVINAVLRSLPLPDHSHLILANLLAAPGIKKGQMTVVFNECVQVDDVEAVDIIIKARLLPPSEIKPAIDTAIKRDCFKVATLLYKIFAANEPQGIEVNQSSVNDVTHSAELDAKVQASTANSLPSMSTLTFFSKPIKKKSDEKKEKKGSRCVLS